MNKLFTIVLLLAGIAGKGQDTPRIIGSTPDYNLMTGSYGPMIGFLAGYQDSTRMDTVKVILELYSLDMKFTEHVGDYSAQRDLYLGTTAYYRYSLVNTIKVKGWAVIPETKLGVMGYEQDQWIRTGKLKFLSYDKQDSLTNVLQVFDRDAAGNPINW